MANKEKLSPVVASGLMTVSGPFGIGKSTLGWLASTDPTSIVYIDGMTSKEWYVAKNDLGLNIIHDVKQSIPAGSYVDLAVMTRGKNDLEAFKIQKAIIEKLPDGLSAIILDDVYFSGAHAYVRKNPNEFKDGGIHGADIQMKTAMEWGAARKMLLPDLYTLLKSKAELVLFLNREKPARDQNGNVLPGMFEPDADKALYSASMFALRLTHNTRKVTDVPAALVMKNNRRLMPQEGRKVVTIFPQRIPAADWATIEEYLKNPIGLRTPREDEIADEAELHTIWNVLSPAQQEQYKLQQQLAMAGVREAMTAAVDAKIAELDIPNKDILNSAVIAALGPEHALLDEAFVAERIEAVIE